jgi:NADH dehydrogenase
MRAAVTGASGFIGGHLIGALRERGHEVVAIRRESFEDESALADRLRGCDVVVHLAGGGFAEERKTWAANAHTTRQLIAASRTVGVPRLLLASTVTTTRPRRGAYGESKLEAERTTLGSGLDATVFRFAFVYGPGTTGVFARLVELTRKLPVVPIVGSGDLDIAPVYVDDVVQAVIAALEQPAVASGKTYTLAGPPATFDEVVDGVLTRLGLHKRKLHLPGSIAMVLARVLSVLPEPPLTRDNVLGMTQDADHDSSLARSELGFAPRPLPEGLDATFSS